MLIKNARIVTPETTFIGVVEVREGRIHGVEEGTTQVPGAVDWEGDHLLPGLVELHTDNLEKHLAPRPGVIWNTHAAFAIHDAQVAAAGITTVFDSLGLLGLVPGPVAAALRGTDHAHLVDDDVAALEGRAQAVRADREHDDERRDCDPCPFALVETAQDQVVDGADQRDVGDQQDEQLLDGRQIH